MLSVQAIELMPHGGENDVMLCTVQPGIVSWRIVESRVVKGCVCYLAMYRRYWENMSCREYDGSNTQDEHWVESPNNKISTQVIFSFVL